MKIFRPMNIFTAAAVVLACAFVFRFVNIVSFRAQDASSIGITTPANAGGFSPQQLHAPPPSATGDTLSQEELDKAVKATAQKPDDSAPTAPAASAGDTPSAAPVPVKGMDKADDNMPPPPDEGGGNFSASEVQVLQSLAKRRDDLDKREKSVAEREALLSAAEQEVDHKIAELNKLKSELEALLGQQQTQESKRIDSLVKIYGGMKPKEAATIFNTLDMDILLQVVGKMSESDNDVRKVGPILANMDPEKARLVTIRLAQQRELPQPVSAAKKALQGQNPPPLPVQPSP